MKKQTLSKAVMSCFFVWLIHSEFVRAQSADDAILLDNKEFCVGLQYASDQWSNYWEGTLKRDNENLGLVSRQTILPMIAVGLGNRLNLMASLAYVRTDASNGTLIGERGVQDWSIWAKYAIINQDGFTLQLLGGASGPAARYNPDYMPLHRGLGAYEGTLRLMTQYQSHDDHYIRAYVSGHVRSHIQLDRYFYYTDRAYYDHTVDMPDAMSYGVSFGKWWMDESLRTEITADGLFTLGGFDIRRQDMPFPSNRINSQFIRFFSRYYIPPAKQFGFSVSAAYAYAGRNAGQSFILNAGLYYQW
jgi:hypothetical protein